MRARSRCRSVGVRRAQVAESLESRTLLAAVSWAAAVDGDFNDPTKWSTGTVPGAADDVSINLPGTYTVTVTNGNAPTVRSLVVGASPASNPTQPTLAIRAGSGSGAATVLTVQADATNYGRLTLTGNNNVHSAAFNVTGVLTNNGRLLVDAGTGGGGGRQIGGNVNNLGTVDVNHDLALVRGGATFSSLGTVNVAAGKTLFITGGAGQTFRQTAGALNLAGAVDAQRATVEIAGGAAGGTGTLHVFDQATFILSGGTLDVDGGVRGENMTFRHSGGSSTGAARVNLLNCQFESSGSPTRSGDFVLRGPSTLGGDVAAGQTLRVTGSNTPTGANNGVLTSASAFTNFGVIELTATDAAHGARIEVASGTFGNAGTVNVNPGVAGGDRLINANVANTGTINVGVTLRLEKTGSTFANNGTVNVAAGARILMPAYVPVTLPPLHFRQESGTLAGAGSIEVWTDPSAFNANGGNSFTLAGGTMDLDGGFLGSNVTFTHSGGRSTGDLPVNLFHSRFFSSGAADRAGAFTIRGTCTIDGDVAAGQAITILGSNTPTGDNNGSLTSAGGFTNLGSITLDAIDQAHASRLVVTSGGFTNEGTVTINRGQFGGQRAVDAPSVFNTGTLRTGPGAGNGFSVLLGRAGGSFNTSGAVQLGPSSHVTLACSDFAQTGGSTALEAGTRLALPGTVRVLGGTLRVTGTPNGVATIQGGLHNAAYVGLPLRRTLNVTGSYVQTAAGTLEVQFGEIRGHGRLAVTGAAAVAGAFVAAVAAGFLAAPDPPLTVVQAASLSGRFASESLNFSDGHFTSAYQPTAYTLSAVTSGIFVTTSDDNVAGSLRQAILVANAAAGADTIRFAIPVDGGAVMIRPVSPLPVLTDPVTINGYTQPGSSPNTQAVGSNAIVRIVLDGSAAGPGADGLVVEAASTITGLEIVRFSGSGVVLRNGGDSRVVGNHIGTDSVAPAGNAGAGVRVEASARNRIGGSLPVDRNVISANGGGGVVIEGAGATGNTIYGNYIGLNAAGDEPMFNGGQGAVVIRAPSNVLGNTDPGAGNLIAGADAAVLLVADSNQVTGNFLNTDHTGSRAFAARTGVQIGFPLGAGGFGQGNAIGNHLPGGRNVIGGDTGISAYGADNRIMGNSIGVGADGTTRIGSTAGGIVTTGGRQFIGSTQPGAGNVIAGGINLSEGTTVVQGNFIGTGPDGVGRFGGAIGVLTRHSTVVGGAEPGAGNLIAGNSIGIQLGQNCIARGNRLVGNADVGVRVAHTNTVIGGMSPGAGNVISGSGVGVQVFAGNKTTIQGNRIFGTVVGVEASDNVSGVVIQGNALGLDAAGTGPAADRNGTGISFAGAGGGNLVGGSLPEAANVIAYSTGPAVSIAGGDSHVVVRGNVIHSNGAGIVLDGFTSNDAGDADEGPNGLLNRPILAFAGSNAGTTVVDGILQSVPHGAFFVDFYATPAAAAGAAQGRTYVGSTAVVTDADGNATFNRSFATAALGGQYLTATATTLSDQENVGETSQFSRPVEIGGLPALSAGDVRVSETDVGVVTANFVVSLSAATRAVSVRYATLPGTATAGVDYQPVSGVLTFAPGETSKSVAVMVLSDAAEELDETFTFVLSEPVGATLGDGVGVGVIANDDDTGPVIAAGAPVLLLARQAVAGEIGAAGDVDLYPFDAEAGQLLAFDLDLPAAEPLDAYLRLFDAAGNELVASDDGAGPGEGPGTEPYVRHTFATAGRYYVGVSAASNRAYRTVGGAAVAGMTMAAAGGAASGAADVGKYVLTMTPVAQVVGRQVFYNNSAFDGRDAAANGADDGAIAADKHALLPGEVPAFANVVSYFRGVNGVMVDLRDLPAGGELSADDFVFVSDNGDATGPRYAPAPVSIVTRPGEGVGGSDRVTIIWADGAIRNQWLRVYVLATAATGLDATDVFSFGSLVGETGSDQRLVVSASDALATRNAAVSRGRQVTGAYDHNRDGVVNVVDYAISRSNLRRGLASNVIPVTGMATGVGAAPVPARQATLRRLGYDERVDPVLNA